MPELKAIFGKAVTTHIYSQKLLEKYNYKPSGIMLGLFPQDVKFKGIAENIHIKTSAVLYTKIIKEDKLREIYIPQKFKNKIKEILNLLEIKYKIGRKRKIKDEKRDEKIEFIKNEIFNVVYLFCKTYTKNTQNIIIKTVAQLLSQKVDVIYLYLDLENPHMPYIAKKCEEIGFFFSGILPYGIDGHHALIYQYLNVSIDVSSIELFNEKSKKLLNYVLRYKNV